MSFKKTKPYYNTPLNTYKTIDLPSNLLQARPSTRYQEANTSVSRQPATLNATVTVTPRPALEPIPRKEEPVHMVEEKQGRKSVLYKRLSDIKNQNTSLEKYSFSKLLSKMVVVDEDQHPYRSVDPDLYNHRAISEYSCLRGRLLNIECEQDKKGEELGKKRKRSSRAEDWANRTTRIFKRFYMPSSDSRDAQPFGRSGEGQKYIYINGKKTECKRIHNFYSSQNYKTSYGKAFGSLRQPKDFFL